ncbi:MAG: TraR/DksA family transcriptional regulator [Spirochaetales bacterium]
MTSEVQHKLREKLESLEQRLSENLDHQKESYRDVAQSERIEPVDEAQVRMQSNNSGAMIYHDEERLTRVRSALTRIRTGDYGSCVTCGTDIDKGRLEAKPEAEFCIECERRHENEEPRPMT